MLNKNYKDGVRVTAFVAVSGSLMVLGSGCSLLNSLTGKSNSANQTAAPAISTQVPSVEAAVGRIQKALPSVSPSTGNFQSVLSQIQTNLPSVTDPTKATGLDQIPLLVYAACTDLLSNGSVSSTYMVNTNQTVAQQTSNIVNAGLTMVNLHVGNLAAAGTPLNSQVSAVFNTLIASDVSAGASTATTFVNVCLAANSFGVGMVGF